MVSDRARGVIAVIGGIIVHSAFGVIVYSFGNMVPYITSYIRERSKPSSLRNKDLPILLAVSVSVLAGFMPIGGMLLRKAGPNVSVLVGGTIMSVGVMLSYLAIDLSFYMLLATYGFLFGFGVSIGYIAPMVCAMKWFPNNKGVVNGIVAGSFGFSAVFFVPIQTAYINPKNLTPNVTLPGSHSNEKYFDDEDILNRTRMSFIIFGIVYACLIVIGSILIAEPSSDYTPETTGKTGERALLTNENDTDSESTLKHQQTDIRETGLNLAPKEMLQTKEFWLLWLKFFFDGIVVIFINGLYKAFGQTFIADDSFLAAVGSTAAVFNAAGRVFWGVIADLFSCRTAMLCVSGSSTIFMLTLMLAPSGGKWMFLFWICAIIFQSTGMFCLIPTVTARAFGTEHVGINTTWMMTCMAISGILGAFVPVILQDTIGWNGLFTVVSAGSAIAFVLTMVTKLRSLTGEYI